MNSQKFKNNNARFPLSTDTLEFMQDQILLVAQLAELVGGIGNNAVLRYPVTNRHGLCVIDGELLPLYGNSSNAKGINITQTAEDINAQGLTFTGARVVRTAQYAASGYQYSLSAFADSGKPVSLLTLIQNNAATLDTLTSRVGTLEKYNLPKGSVIDYYSEDAITPANCPDGFVPTETTGMTSTSAITEAMVIQSWRLKGITVTLSNFLPSATGGVTKFGATYRIATANGITIPHGITNRADNLHPLCKVV